MFEEIIFEIRAVKSAPRDLKKFGVGLGIAFFALAAILWWRGSGWFAASAIAGFLLVLLGIFSPGVLRPFHRAWMALAVVLGFVMTRIILAVAFFVIITPLAFLMKIFKAKPLALDFKTDAESYWLKRETKKFRPADAERQF